MENKSFFDPYSQFIQPNTPPAYVPPIPNNDYLGSAVTPKDFFEQQATYYRYLTTMMEYNLKSREYEKALRQDKCKNSPN